MRFKLFAAALAGFALLGTNAYAQTEIQWWHSMTAVNNEWVNDLAKEFNASQKDYKVVPTFKGTYADSFTAAIVTPSTPAAPLLRRTRSHASHRTSLLWIRSYNAWNRRVLLCLAHTYSWRWSCRTCSLGVLAVSGMPSHLPPRQRDQSKARSLQRVVLRAFPGTVDLSDSLLAPCDFSRPALYARSLPDSAAGEGLSCSVSSCRRMPSSLPRGSPAPLRSRAQSVAFAAT